jgi:hypothetical protein
MFYVSHVFIWMARPWFLGACESLKKKADWNKERKEKGIPIWTV